ncbi:MAG: amidohydrolase family protein [Lachnospiraceae bacterium]|nr:amidohydrolase family protein [Lachnospiraceae bacterium]MBP5224493.1 amidohydrolase family protein [Lachnospiraceae bacterium]
MEPEKKYGFHPPVLRLDVHCHLGKHGAGIPVKERMELDRLLGIDHCVILPSPVQDGTNILHGCMGSEEARKTAEKYPEHFSWFVNAEPDGTDAVRKKLTSAKEAGAKGVGEFGTKLRFDDAWVDELLEICGELGLPFLFHISPYGTGPYGVIDEKGLPGLESALKKHPGTVFIGHSQPFWYELGRYDPDLPEPALNGFPFCKVGQEGRAVELLRTYDNLYADLSAVSGLNAILRDQDYGVRFLTEFSSRLLYGTDLTGTDFIFPLGQVLDYYLLSGRISEAVYRKICRENAASLLGIPL